MTICALLFKNSFPIVITDNLISNKLGSNNLSTPLTNNENREGLNGYKPAGIASKIWKISIDNEISRTYYMIYSGTVKDALDVSNFLKNKLCYKTVDEINDVEIKEYIEFNKLNISIILVFSDKNGYMSHYYINAYLIPFGKHEPVISIGSGIEELNNEIQYLYFKHKVIIEDTAKQDIHRKISISLLLISQLTSDYLHLEDYSAFAKKSCGALYNLYTFPPLYFNSMDAIPKYFKNGSCQIFVDFCFIQNKFYIKRIVHTKQNYDTEEVISTAIELTINIPDGNKIQIERNKISTKSYIIRQLKDKSYIIDNQTISFSSNQVIIYASIGKENVKTVHYLPSDEYDIIYAHSNKENLILTFNYMGEENFFSRITNRIYPPYFLYKESSKWQTSTTTKS